MQLEADNTRLRKDSERLDKLQELINHETSGVQFRIPLKSDLRSAIDAMEEVNHEDLEPCWKCGGEGLSHHDCGEDCCCCAEPINNVKCDICNGEGYIPDIKDNS